MATATDLKNELISSFNDVLTAITEITNMKETLANGKKNYEIFVLNSDNGGKDSIVINDNGNTSDANRYTIIMNISSNQTEFTKKLITKATLTSGEFGTLESSFTSKLEIFRSDIYNNSVTMVDSVAQNMVNRL